MRACANKRRSFVLLSTVVLLCGCNATNTANNTGSQQQGGQGQLQVEPLPQSGQSNANWGADKGGEQAKAPSFQRGALLSQVGGGGGGGGTAPAPAQAQNSGPPPVDYAQMYPKYRLDKAAVIKNYAHVSVVPVGIDAFVKTAWTNGMLHIRLALLGPLKNLQEFQRTQNDLKLTFQDKAGNALKQVIVPMTEMKEAPSSTNFGTPTYVVEGSMECSLELYEEFYQWMFEWE